MKFYYVYIMASKKNGTLYIGVTNDLLRRVDEHKRKVHQGFTSKYDVTRLEYYKETDDISVALTREKRMKKWKRPWKIELIESMNPEWNDLFDELIG